MRMRDTVTGVVFLAIGIAFAVMSQALPVRSLPNTPGPAFFPSIVALAVIGLSLVLIARGVLVKLAADRVSHKPEKAASPPGAGLLLAGFVLYVGLLPTLGFVLATLPFLAGLTVLFGERRPAAVAALALATTLGLYVIFRHGFQIILPQGLLSGIVP